MASTTLAADLTVAAIKTKTEEERAAVWKKYDEYCASAVPSLNMLNQVSVKLFFSGVNVNGFSENSSSILLSCTL
jgi:hypothetical protein